MADSKISALPASTTPLAGTEVLPIVQSGATVKVAVSNLTAGRSVATGDLAVTGTFNVSQASATVAVVSGSTTVGSNNGQLRVRDTATTTKSLDIGMGGDTSTAFMQAQNVGIAYLNLILQPNGGNVGVGVAPTSYQFQVNTDSAAKPGVGGLWTVVSDERIKTDIVPADLSRCYEIVKQVGLKYFAFAPNVYSEDQVNDKHNLGWIAQDVQKVFSKAVSVKPFTLQNGDVIEDCLDLNSGQLIAALYGSVQMLMAKVEALEAKS